MRRRHAAYWDETSEDSLTKGIPWALTRQHVELDGETIPNPLRSFVFLANVTDRVTVVAYPLLI